MKKMISYDWKVNYLFILLPKGRWRRWVSHRGPSDQQRGAGGLACSWPSCWNGRAIPWLFCGRCPRCWIIWEGQGTGICWWRWPIGRPFRRCPHARKRVPRVLHRGFQVKTSIGMIGIEDWTSLDVPRSSIVSIFVLFGWISD